VQVLPDGLQLLWTRQFPKLKPTYREPRIQFDAGYEPVVLGNTLFVAVPSDDSVRAFDTTTGEQRWEFLAEGPVRLAPAAWKDRVFLGSDDGHLYCVSAAEGTLLWKFQAVPSNRKVLGNGRLISVWPVRGGPVLHEGKVYFAAGVFPFEGVFVYCLEAETGNVVWRNDESGYLYGIHPHGAESIGGVTPQGYLVVAGNELIVPCGQGVPARFDLATGKLLSFELPKPGRLPGGWFASADVRRGEVVLDATINRDLHEDKIYQGPGEPDVRTTIRVAEREFRFGDGLPDVGGEIHTMLAADGKLFVVTTDGVLDAFGEKGPVSAVRHAWKRKPLEPSAAGTNSQAELPLRATDERHGYAAVLGIADIAMLDSLLEATQLHVIGVDADAEKIDRLRRRYAAAGLYGGRIALLTSEPGRIELPPYFAGLAIFAGKGWFSTPDGRDRRSVFEMLRPYGGTACVTVSDEEHARLASEGVFADWLTVTRRGSLTILRREGALSGAANYTGGWTSAEERVKAPLGLLWFDDTLGHFKRSPQPYFFDGLMISYCKDWMARHREGRKVPYDLLPAMLSDVYTGRVLSEEEQTKQLPNVPTRDRTAAQPNQYRPPYQTDDWKPEKPVPGERVNPLTGEREPRTFPKSYGCDGGVDYGPLYTMRSGTAAFYDKRVESGTCYISGPRSGCTNSIIPACGLLNVPYFYEGCTCAYPLPCGLALVSMPPEYEQWAAWGEGKAANVQRVGINFGAPGDRMTESGTLWLDYPSRGGPSPEVQVEVEPADARYYYRHSLWIEGGTGWPWVAASGVEGADRIKITGLCEGHFTVRLSFADPEKESSGDRLFDIVVNGRTMIESYDIAKAAGGSMRATILEFEDVPADGSVEIELVPRKGEPILGGIELVSRNDGDRR
jgi:outer membrane protein assembly factor BamB